jgi:hypothetical protein
MIDIRDPMEESEEDLRCPRERERRGSLSLGKRDMHFIAREEDGGC